jgi:hypothetical protein
MFPDDLTRYILLAIQVLRRLKWLFVAGYYYSTWFAILAFHDFRLLVAPLLLLAVPSIAYLRDRQREEHAMDDFKGSRLFFRYGQLLYRAVISIPVRDDWSFQATQVSAQTLRATLAQRIVGRLPAESVQVIGDKVITDLQTGEQKKFIRVWVRSSFGSMVTFFVHYAVFGHTITAHYYTYRRGAHHDWDAIKFILASPLTIWFWIIPWLRNRYSIIASSSHFRESSFDEIDLLTMLCVVHRVVFGETEKMLEEAHLLTEEIRQQIHNHINNYNQIGISGSSNVNIGNGNVVRAPAPAPQPAQARPAARPPIQNPAVGA